MSVIDPSLSPEHTCGSCTAAPALSRRRVLSGGAALVAVGALAACGSSSSPGAPSTGAPATDGGSSGTDQGAGGLVALADVPVGGAVLVTAASGEVVVAQPEEGTVLAFSAVCTHQGCVVEVDGAELVCPCHGSVFEALTGQNVSGPAPSPLPAVAVEVRDGQVVES